MADEPRNPADMRRRAGIWIAGCLIAALVGVVVLSNRPRVAGWDPAAQQADPAGFAAHLDGLLIRSRDSLVATRDRLAAAPVPAGERLGASATEAAAAKLASLIERVDEARRELNAQRELIASKVTREVSATVVATLRATLDDAEAFIQSDVLRHTEAENVPKAPDSSGGER